MNKMKNSMFGKTFVIGIIILFVGASVLPSISGDIEKSIKNSISTTESDHFLDLAVANMDDGDISILLGDGDGDFGDRHDYSVGGWPGDIVVGDFNLDGFPDLAVARLIKLMHAISMIKTAIVEKIYT